MWLGHEDLQPVKYGLGAIEVVSLSGFLPSTRYDPHLSQIPSNNRGNRIPPHASRLYSPISHRRQSFGVPSE
jgi:hypothetical protein